MGMSMHVKGFKPPDEKYRAMADVWNSCEAAGIAPPKEVSQFFDDEEPDPTGMEVKIPYKDWGDDSREGFEVEIDKLPAGVKVIRFYCSY